MYPRMHTIKQNTSIIMICTSVCNHDGHHRDTYITLQSGDIIILWCQHYATRTTQLKVHLLYFPFTNSTLRQNFVYNAGQGSTLLTTTTASHSLQVSCVQCHD